VQKCAGWMLSCVCRSSHIRLELLRDQVTFWLPKAGTAVSESGASLSVDATQVKNELRNTVFNFFDADKMGELDLEQTVRCLTLWDTLL